MTEAKRMAEAHLDRRIDELHDGRLRVWSILSTFFGDAIAPRGGVLWLRTFRPLATRLRIEPGTVGAALSRLTADGWLVREKRGRHSLYRQDEPGRKLFEEASQRIYGDGSERPWDGRWQLLILPPGASAPPGFAPLDERTWARPYGGAPAIVPSGSVQFTASADDTPALRALVGRAWGLEPVSAAYRRWLDRYAPLRAALEDGDGLEPLAAMCARLLLVHDFRRVVLKDPELPRSLRGPDWPGFLARREAGQLYRALLSASEAWLDASDASPDGPLPRPNPSFYKRFGGLR